MTSPQTPAPSPGFPFDPADVAPRLLAWYDRHRRTLPWRARAGEAADPYRVWLSEIMLQQTTVRAVVPYFERFLRLFPTVEALAGAPAEEVMKAWAGLGYYSRARNLHACAMAVVERHGGRFPAEEDALRALPGIGAYTAAAVAAIAFDRRAVVVDGNVRRVLVRLFALTGDPRAAAAERQLWLWATALTSHDRPHDYAQAIMDLGATLCTPQAPMCPACPLAGLCLARRHGLERQLPAPRARKAVPVRRQVAVLVDRAGASLARPRPATGFLGGLWELPNTDLRSDESPLAAAGRLVAEFGLGGAVTLVGQLQHAYSHFTLQLALVRIRVAAGCRVAEGEWQWLPAPQLQALPLHGAHRKALQRFLASAPSAGTDG
jgi:A/G-specific adenine glycosylase